MKLSAAFEASIALSFRDVSDAYQFFPSTLGISDNPDYRANLQHCRITDIDYKRNHAGVSDHVPHDASEHKWSDVFQYRNIPLNIVGMLCWLTCLVVLSALMPSYLTDYLHLSLEQMGFVLSAIGFGGTIGALIMPALSDRFGRKPIMIISVLGAASFLLMLMGTGAEPAKLFGLLLMTLLFVFSLITLTVGPISAESVPAKLMSTASGIVIGVGEIFGGWHRACCRWLRGEELW